VGLNIPKDFGLFLVRNLIEEAGKCQDRPTPRLVGKPSTATKYVVRHTTLASEIVHQIPQPSVFNW
jgi:hypothetical protein